LAKIRGEEGSVFGHFTGEEPAQAEGSFAGDELASVMPDESPRVGQDPREEGSVFGHVTGEEPAQADGSFAGILRAMSWRR